MRSRDRWLVIVLGVWVLAPIALLVLRALTPAWRYPQILPSTNEIWPTLAWPMLSAATRSRMVPAVVTSIWLALATGIASTGLGFLIARTVARTRPTLHRMAMATAIFAVVAPPLALGVGLQIAMLQLGLSGTMSGVFLAHLVPATGYLTLFAAGILGTLNPALEDEARTLGASRRQVWFRVLVPLLRRRLAEGFALGALVSWSQLAITLVVGGGVVRTLPLELLSFVRAGNDQLGSLAALALTVPPMLALGVVTMATRRTGAAV
jgi:putative spermidine/putrescine transport system permease protein